MDLVAVRTFFMWCTILNGVLLTVSFLICTMGADWVYRMHSKWFPLPRETFNTMLYAFLGFYKLVYFVYCVIPNVSQLIMS